MEADKVADDEEDGEEYIDVVTIDECKTACSNVRVEDSCTNNVDFNFQRLKEDQSRIGLAPSATGSRYEKAAGIQLRNGSFQSLWSLRKLKENEVLSTSGTYNLTNRCWKVPELSPYDHEVEQFHLGRIDGPIVPGVNEVIKNVNTTSTDPKIIEEQWNRMSNYFEERDDDSDSFPGIRSSESDDDEVDEDEELPDIDDVGPAPVRPQPVYDLPLEYKNKITTEPEKSKKSDPVTPTRTSRSSGRGRKRGESCMELVTASGKTIDILGEIRNETRSKTRTGFASTGSKPKPSKSIEEQNKTRLIESNRKSSSSPTKKKTKKKRRSSSRSPHPTKTLSSTSQPHLPVGTKEVRRSPDVTSTTSSQSPSKSRRRSNSESTIRLTTSTAKRNLDASADSDGEVVITKEKAKSRRKERELLAANKIKIEKENSTSPQRRSSFTASPDRRTKEKEPLPEWDPEMPILQPQPFHYTSDLIISSAPSLKPEQPQISRKERGSRNRKSDLVGIEKRSSRRKSNSEGQDTDTGAEMRKLNRVTFSESVEKVKPKKRKSSVVLSLERPPSPKTSLISLNTVDGASKPHVPPTASSHQNLSSTSAANTSVTRAKGKIDDQFSPTKKSERFKKKKKRDKKHKEIRSKSTDAVAVSETLKTVETVPEKESSNDDQVSGKRKRKRKRLEREIGDRIKPKSERLAKRMRIEESNGNESEKAKDTTPKAKPSTPVVSDTLAAVCTGMVTETSNTNRPLSATASSFITSPEDIPSYAGKSLIEVMNELSNSSLDDRSKSPKASAAPQRSKSPTEVVVEEPSKLGGTKSPLLSSSISSFSSSKSAFVPTSLSLTSSATTQIPTDLQERSAVIMVVPAPLKVSQTTQTDDTTNDIEMFPSSRLLQPRASSNWGMKVVDGDECEPKAKGLKALALVSLAYGDDDMDSVVQEDNLDSDYDKPNRIMAELHESAERISSPPPEITLDSDPEDVYSLFDFTEGPSVKREAEQGIKIEVDIPAKYDLFEETTCQEDPFMRLNKVEIDSQQEFSNGSDVDERQFSPEGISTSMPYSPPSNFYEPEEDYQSNICAVETERNSPEPCCSNSLKNIDSLEMPPPLMPPPKSPRKPLKRKKEAGQSKPSKQKKEPDESQLLSRDLEQAALAAAGVKQQTSDVETFEIMRNPRVLRHALNKIQQAQAESFPEEDIRRVISGDYSDITEVCSVRYATKKPEKRKRNSQGIKVEDEDSDGSQSDQEMDALAAIGSEVLFKKVQTRSKDALKKSADPYIPQGDQFDLSQKSMCFYNIFGPSYAIASRSHKQWTQRINEMSEYEHKKIFDRVSLKLHAVLKGEYNDSERFDMWKRDDPALKEKYITARDGLFSDNTLDHYNDFICCEFDSVIDAVIEKYRKCEASDAIAKHYRETLRMHVLLPETLTLVLASVAKMTLEQAARVMNQGKHAPPIETSSSDDPEGTLSSSND